jgi:hypothetical protein
MIELKLYSPSFAHQSVFPSCQLCTHSIQNMFNLCSNKLKYLHGNIDFFPGKVLRIFELFRPFQTSVEHLAISNLSHSVANIMSCYFYCHVM